MARPRPQARYAIYFTPPPYSPLARFGAGVIGYDCFEKVDVGHLMLAGIGRDALALATNAPRQYGFHATIVAPFVPNGSEHDVLEALDAFCAAHFPVPIGPLKVTALDDFIALTPAKPPAELFDLETACVHAFNPLRAPLSAEDRERRLAAGLTERQKRHLEEFGYPYVIEDFRFHMTLTGRLPPAERSKYLLALTAAYAPLAGNLVDVDALSLVRQSERGSRFEVVERRSIRKR